MTDAYRTLEATGRAEHRVDGSRFLAEALPVADRPAAEAAVDEVRTREHKATHHCSAFRVGATGDTFHYDDDGEPSGTAGAPILRQIDAREVTNVLVVVTRYYGGTKLGTGGLARAYGTAADRALSQAPIVEHVVRRPVRIQYDYDDTAPAEQVLRRFDVTEMDSRYTDVTTKTVGVRPSDVDAFVETFTNALGGRGTILQVGEDADENESLGG